MIITGENLFLIVLALVWIVGAVLQDLHRREVDNLWNFSLIGFALAYRFAISIFSGEYAFFVNGVFGFFIFLVLGNLFYYGRLFAGGDAKLVIALGTILPLSYDWIINFKIFGIFIVGFLLGGSIYVFLWSMVLVVFNFRNFLVEYRKQFFIYKIYFLISLVFIFIVALAFYFIDSRFVLLSLVFLFIPVFFVFARSIENVCMIKMVLPKDLTVGDWLNEDLYIGGKKIARKWEGVSPSELKLIREKYRRKVLVKYGVPFTPSFLIGLLVVLYLSYYLRWF